MGDPSSYALSIDWSGVGGFPDNGDTARLRSFRSDRGRESTFAGSAESNEVKLARNKVGSLTLTLDNDDRRYDVYYSSSPLYPKVSPGKVVRLRVTDDASITYTIFTGIIDDIRAIGNDRDPRVQITCSDNWKVLSQRPIPTAFYSPNTIYPVLTDILSYAGVPLGIKHESGASLKEVLTTWVLEPVTNSSGLLSPDQVISSPQAGEQMPMVGGITY